MQIKIFVFRLMLCVWSFLPCVRSHGNEPGSLGRTANHFFESRTPLTVKVPSRQTSSYPAYHVSEPADGQVLNNDKETREMIDSFLVRESRNSFIARVYGILAVQLVITAVSITLFGTNRQLQQSILTSGVGIYVPMVSGLVSFFTVLIMTFSTHARRSSPLKYQLLALFTLGEAVSVGFVSSFYKFRTVVSAMLATALATTVISVYTVRQKNPKYDLSQWGAALSSCGFIFIALLLVQVLQTTGVVPTFLPLNDTFVAFLGTCLFSFYLAYHTKLIVSGKHSKYRMNDKDFVFGAMTLYSDIIALFLQLLELLGNNEDKSSFKRKRRH